jgi:hypothetical protein
VKLYTVHVRDRREPVLVREGFSWGALIFGPFWLFAHRAWLAGGLVLLAGLTLAGAPQPGGLVLDAGFAWALGLFGNDLRRWTLAQRGYTFAGVVGAPDPDAALARLLQQQPDLMPEALA